MIRIETEGPIGDEFIAWRLKAEKARNKMIKDYLETGKRPNPDKYQKIWKELKEIFLVEIFHGKCAFCEASLQLTNCPPDVEHYRPKKGVTVDREKIEHPGYFWLACEWYNLLLVCRNCNSGHSEDVAAGQRKSHPGKGREFPIGGERICKPSDNPTLWAKDLESEKPLLLDPYFDDPEKHIAFSDLGVPYAKAKSARGLATIKACHLDRDGLCTARRTFANDLLRKRLHTLMEIGDTKLFRPDDQFSAWLKHALPMLLKEKLEKSGMKIAALSAH
jgi:hypothetical protein